MFNFPGFTGPARCAGNSGEPVRESYILVLICIACVAPKSWNFHAESTWPHHRHHAKSHHLPIYSTAFEPGAGASFCKVISNLK